MDIFCEIPCLTERSSLLNGLELCKRWFPKADRRVPGEALQKFIAYNSQSFGFLEVTPSIVGTDHNASICFRTSRFIGAIPLRSPDTGKQIGDLVVAPRFVGRDRFDDYIEILDLLGGDISPEVADSLPLASGANFRPPFYLEAVKFVSALEEMLKRPWRKFDCVEVVRKEPVGQINWRKYVQHEYRGDGKLNFPVRKNVLSELHYQYGQIRFVYDLCSNELLSSNTPQRVKSAFQSRLSFIEKKLYLHKAIATESVTLSAKDSAVVKSCKIQANRILKRELADSTAWRVDFNDVFEKFVQYIFKQIARTTGGKLLSNPLIPGQSRGYHAWELRHLEPDAIFQNGDLIAFIDAKYKSHLFNRFEISELLKDDFRRDLHQVMAYTSFTNVGDKIGFICYPSSVVEIKTTQFRNPLNDATNKILILGIPLKRTAIPEAIRCIADRLEDLRQK